ncbi:MAG: hypothetical protein SGPRY_013137 [Prymnesium sp.]
MSIPGSRRRECKATKGEGSASSRRLSEQLARVVRLYSELSEQGKRRAFDYVSNLHQLEAQKTREGATRPILTSERFLQGHDPSIGSVSEMESAMCKIQPLPNKEALARNAPEDHLDSFVSSVFPPPHVQPQLMIHPPQPLPGGALPYQTSPSQVLRTL